MSDINAFLATKGPRPPDGMIPDKGSDAAFRSLAGNGAEILKPKLDLGTACTT